MAFDRCKWHSETTCAHIHRYIDWLRKKGIDYAEFPNDGLYERNFPKTPEGQKALEFTRKYYHKWLEQIDSPTLQEVFEEFEHEWCYQCKYVEDIKQELRRENPKLRGIALEKKARKICKETTCWCEEVSDAIEEIANERTDFAFEWLEKRWKEFMGQKK